MKDSLDSKNQEIQEMKEEMQRKDQQITELFKEIDGLQDIYKDISHNGQHGHRTIETSFNSLFSD